MLIWRRFYYVPPWFDILIDYNLWLTGCYIRAHFHLDFGWPALFDCVFGAVNWMLRKKPIHLFGCTFENADDASCKFWTESGQILRQIWLNNKYKEERPWRFGRVWLWTVLSVIELIHFMYVTYRGQNNKLGVGWLYKMKTTEVFDDLPCENLIYESFINNVKMIFV